MNAIVKEGASELESPLTGEIMPDVKENGIDTSKVVDAIGDMIAKDFKNYIEEIDGETIKGQELSWTVFQRVCRDYRADGKLYGLRDKLPDGMCQVIIAKPDAQSVDTKICSIEVGQKLADDANKNGLILGHVLTNDRPSIDMEGINFFMKDAT